MKKLQISSKEFIRKDDHRYNLTDLFRLTTLSGIRLEPWAWAQSENRTRDISRRGWFFKKCWGKEQTLIEYAKYLSPVLYTDVIKALGMNDVQRLIAFFGELRAARLDPRVAEYLAEREAAKAEQARRINEDTIALRRTVKTRPLPDLKVKEVMQERIRKASSTPTRSMSHSRSMGSSVTHHRSEPDYLTQALVTQAVVSDWNESSHRHSTHHSDDSCYSSHSSHDSHSWSGDSGGSSDSGGGGCGD